MSNSASNDQNQSLTDELIELQTRVTFQEDTLQQLNTIVTQQDQEIRQLHLQLQMLAKRFDDSLFQQEQQGGSKVVDERPPHY
jgi:SlyX protein